MILLIENIKNGVISNRWANGKGAGFQYEVAQNQYRLLELSPDFQKYKVEPSKRNDTNCPVVAKGIIAYLIRNWGLKEVEIYNNYYTSCFANYEKIESQKPGSYNRNLNADFYPLHVSNENESVKFSNLIKPYLSDPEILLINQYVQSYFEYIAQIYAPKHHKEENVKEARSKNRLSVSDWCIIFYYMDEPFLNESNKIGRMKKFIEDNNVLSPTGSLTTIGNFKKEYHRIENRINGKNGKKSLPPKRIEKILPYLKNNKEAMQKAKNDIDYLQGQTKESKENNY